MNNKSNKITSAIIIIGNEILSGRTQEVNISHLSIWLNKLGVRVEEVRIIPDIENKIVNCVNELRRKFNYVFTTGGIGPTHDDITAKSISKAFNLNYEMHQEAFNILEKYYKPGEFNEGRQRMAMMPSKANLIYNPTSGAPGFFVENVFCNLELHERGRNRSVKKSMIEKICIRFHATVQVLSEHRDSGGTHTADQQGLSRKVLLPNFAV